MKKSLVADLSLIIIAMVWGSGFVATKILLDGGVGPYYMMGFRFLIALIALGVLFNKSLKTITKKDLKNGMIVGLFLFAGFATQTVGLQYTTPSVNAFLTGVNVVIVPFLYWGITKKQPDKYAFMAVFICFIGTSFISNSVNIGFGKGEALSLVCAFLFAGQIVFNGFFVKETGAQKLTIIQMGTATILSFIFAGVSEAYPKGMDLKIYSTIIYMGLVTTALAFFVQTWAQSHTTSTKTAIILSMEAVFGTLFSVWILSEVLTLNMVLGGLAIILAIITAETKWNFLKKN